MSQVPRAAWAAWLAVCLIWGTTYLGIRVALETIPPALMGGFRWTAAGLLLLAWVRARGGALPPARDWPGLALLGLLMLGVGNGFVAWAELFVPSGLTAVILATSPFWMSGVEALLPRGERPTSRLLAGLVVGFAGILLLVWPDLWASGVRGSRFGAGIVALQLACAGWALGSSYSRRHVPGGDPLAATALQMIFGGVLMFAGGTALGEWSRVSFATHTALALGYLTIAGSIGGYGAYIYALRHLPVSTVSLYAYVNPVIAVVLGAVLLGEPFGARIAIAVALVLSGVTLARMGPGSLAALRELVGSVRSRPTVATDLRRAADQQPRGEQPGGPRSHEPGRECTVTS